MDFRKTLKHNLFKFRPVGTDLLHADRRMDGQTDRHYETGSHFSYFFERG